MFSFSISLFLFSIVRKRWCSKVKGQTSVTLKSICQEDFRFNRKLLLHVYMLCALCTRLLSLFFFCLSFVHSFLWTFFRLQKRENGSGWLDGWMTGALLSVCFATSKIFQWKCFYAFNIHFKLNHMSAIQLPRSHVTFSCTRFNVYMLKVEKKHQTDSWTQEHEQHQTTLASVASVHI